VPAPRSLLLRLLGALAALALLTSACGGDDDSGGETDATIEDNSESDGSDGEADGGTEEEPDDGEGAGGGDLPNPCELISLSEMEAAFGFAWSEGEHTPPEHGTSQCVWSDADPAMPAKIVSLAIGTDDSFGEAFNQSAKQLYEGTKAFVEEADILEADVGIGDESYRTEGGVYVLDGDTYYSFTTIGGLSDEAVAGVKAMATKVVEG